MKHILVLVLFTFCLSSAPLFAQIFRNDAPIYNQFNKQYTSSIKPKPSSKVNFTPKRTKEYLKSSAQKKSCRKSVKRNTVNYYHKKKGFISWLLEVDRKFREEWW